MRIAILAGMGMVATVLFTVPVRAQAPSVLTLDFKADVLADGSLANIEPDPSLTPMFQSMLRTRVAGWRYQLGTWQGKPVPRSISQQIEAEPVPVPSGGFALRIKRVTAVRAPLTAGVPASGSSMYPPEYPLEARRNGVQGTFVYALRVDPQGKPYDIELVAPENPGRGMRTLDAAARTAMTKWTLSSIRGDGVATDCRELIPVEFALGSNPSRELPDLAPYRARYADACPAAPELRTEVAGTLL